MSKSYTLGPWRLSDYPHANAVVADAPTGIDDEENIIAYGGHLVCESVRSAANARLIAAAPDLLGALLLLTGNPHIDLGDLVYQVREREGKGWDGPAVLAWARACEAAKAAIAKATGAQS